MVALRAWRSAALALCVVLLLGVRPAASQVNVGFNPVTYTVMEGGDNAMVMVELTGMVEDGEMVVVTVSTQDGTAVAGSDGDYQDTTMTLTFNSMSAGMMSVTVPIIDDERSEGDETFTVNVALDSGNATISPASAEVLIQDNSDFVTVGFAEPSYTIVEGQTVRVCVSLSMGFLERNITITISPDASSVADSAMDVDGIMNVAFGPGDTLGAEMCIDVTATLDTMLEAEGEVLLLVLGSPDGRIMFSPNTTIVLITMATVMLDDYPGVVVQETDGAYEACISISPTLMINVSVILSTSDGTAIAGQDYTAVNTEVVFPSGMAQVCVNVPIINDDAVECNDTFVVTVSAIDNNVVVVNGNLTVTIAPDPIDVLMVSVPGNVPATEGNGVVSVCVTLTAVEGLQRNLEVSVETRDGTALAGVDYTPVTTVLIFSAASMEECVNITLLPDDMLEEDETFMVVVSSEDPAVTMPITQDTTIVTIAANGAVTIGFDMETVSVDEGESVRLCANVTAGALGLPVTLNIASNPTDLATVPLQLMFLAGDVGKCFMVEIPVSSSLRMEEVLTLTLSSSATGVTLQPSVSTVTINVLSIGLEQATYNTEEGTVVSVCAEVTSSGYTLDRDTLVTLSTVDGSAMAPADYTAETTVLIFGPAVTSQCVNISTIDNTVFQDDKVFSVMLVAMEPDLVELSLNSSMVTITENDNLVIGFQTSPVLMVVEGNQVTLMFGVLNGTLGTDIAVTVRTNDGTATAVDADYTAVNEVLVLNSTQVTQNVVIMTLADMVTDESTVDVSEMFSVQLSQGTPSSLISISPDTTNIVIIDAPFISQSPMDVFVLPEETAVFTVVASGSDISYQWLFEGMENLVDDPGAIDGSITNTLTITNVTEMDIGNYSCRVSNLVTNVTSSEAQLQFLMAPMIVDSTGDVGVLVGGDITLSCSAVSLDGAVNITWTTSNPAVTLPTPVVTSSPQGVLVSTITLTQVDMESSGNYTCTASNRFTMAQQTFSLFVITISGVEDVVATTGTDATLFCDATGHPDLTYAWGRAPVGVFFSIDTFLDNMEDRVTGANTNMLTFTNVGVVDAQRYGCNVSLFGDLIGPAFGNLSTRGPTIIASPVDVTVNTSDTLILNCTAMNNDDAVRPLMFTWFRDFTVLQNPTTELVMVANRTFTNTLTVTNVGRDDAGMYQCAVTNREPSEPVDAVRSNEALVIINFVPEVTLTLDGEQVTAFNLPDGISATIRCTAMAEPELTSLEISSIFGGVRETVAFSNSTPVMQLDQLNNETISVSPMLSQSGTMYECVAVNVIGRGSSRIVVTVQAPPAMVNHSDIAVNITDLLTVTLIWTSPPDNNAPVTGFLITSCVLDVASMCIPASSVQDMFTLSSPVAPGTRVTRREMYAVESRIRVFIAALNDIGMGTEDPMGYDFNTAGPSDGIPFNAMEILLNSTAVVYSWQTAVRGTGNGIQLTQYNITVNPSGSGTQPLVAVTSRTDTPGRFGAGFSGLVPGLMHNVSVVAVFGTPQLVSDPLTFIFVTVAAGQEMPLLPDMRATAETNSATTATVRWPDPPDLSFFTRFIIRISSTIRTSRKKRQNPDPPVEKSVNNPSARSLEIITDPFSDVTVSVAVEYQPDGSPVIEVPLVDEVMFRSPEGAAGPPTDLVVTPAGFTSLQLIWMLPAVTNGIIIDHMVQFRPRGVAGVSSTRTNSADTAFTLTELMANTQYEVAVRSLSSVAGELTPFMTASTELGVFPPTASVIGSDTSNSRFIIAIGLNEIYGPISFFQVVVTRSNRAPTRGFTTDPLSASSEFYVAFQADFSRQLNYVLGADNAVAHMGVVFNNSRLDADTSYYVFVRAFSDLDRTIFADSNYTAVIRFDGPLNTVAIIVPIAAVALILLIILVVLLLFAYLTMRGTFRRHGYAPAGTVLLEDGKRRGKGAAIELRRTRLFSPVLNVGSPDVFTSAGQPTTLICEASGTPAPEVTWTHNDQPLDKERFIQLADGSLFINDTDLQDEGTYVVRATNMAGDAEVQVRVTVLRPIPPEPDADHTPIKVGEFSEKIALVRAEDDEGLEDEYADVELDWTFSSYTAKLNINKNKNRYINIIPYDHSRVVLSLQDSTPGSDYINASFVDAYQRPNGYIASQGPIPSTFPDFWRMVWELDSPTIVMVTNLKEEDKIKCHQYWPSYGTTTYGNIQVTLKEVENLAEYSIRTFNVSPLAGQSRVQMPVREVRQFHFLVWPDHGVPQYATNLLSFRKRILKYHPEKRGPMVVHCSAGVGRTGTFITIDYMLKQMEAEGTINIFNFVRHMRYRRNYMVQTSPQYVFIHDALLEFIMCGDNSIKAPEMRARVKDMQQVIQETGKTIFETQFNTLLTASPPDDDFDCSIAQLPDNLSKNRCKVHLPANDYRVTLSADGDQSDYICASYVDNYRERNAFIVTQAPLANTVADFWRMMWETKSAAIVMLTELTEGDQEMCVKYWPSGVGDPSVYGGYQVELSEDEKDRGSYITRRFKLSPLNKPQESRMISQFHFTTWTKTTPPTDCHPMIDLIDELQRVQRKSGNMPITVHCDDGLSRTGAFCALYSVLERVKTEQIVDVFQAVKTLRIQRTGLLGTIEEYEFVHRAVIEFLDTFSDYQNFK